MVILKGTSKPYHKLDNEILILFKDLKNEIKEGHFITHIVHYRSVQLITYKKETLTNPLLTMILLRALSIGSCSIADEFGRREDVTWWRITRQAKTAFIEYFKIRTYLRGIKQEISSLEVTPEKAIKVSLDLRRNPIYLRTDLWFGVHSGGSVGHIAGVLNRLNLFSGKPLFFSTDTIPTVDKSIETHIVLPQKIFWDYSEMPSFTLTKEVVSAIEKKCPENSISFIYQRYSLNNYAGVKLSNTFRIPFVLEYNGSEIWISRNWLKSLKYETLSERIEMLNLKSADIIVVVSDVMKKELKQRGINDTKILVNPNGVDPDKYSPNIDGGAVRTTFGLMDKFVVGFIGTFGPWHGAEILVDAGNELLTMNPEYCRKVHFLFIGDGSSRRQCENMVNTAYRNNFTFTGLVPQDQGPQYLAACNVLVAPHVQNPDGTKFFGSPTKLFEYMSMGKPIIASRLEQIGEVLEHNKTAILIESGNISQLVHGLELLMCQPELCRILGMNAREEALLHYTWDKHVKKTIDALTYVLH
ncbi:MAG: glycosyltransferase family 4 protein [Ignavibacteriales bacterium]|nr:glycosyltransferase family 4 protein [Ignavibacteriales bacterium]